MAEQQVLTKWCLIWGSGSKHASKIYTQKKKYIPPYTSLQNVRAAKSWLMHTALPFCVEFFLLAPIHFVRFLQDPAVYSYSTIVKSDHSTIVKSDPLGWISRGIISRGISHISTYLSCFIIPCSTSILSIHIMAISSGTNWSPLSPWLTINIHQNHAEKAF